MTLRFRLRLPKLGLNQQNIELFDLLLAVAPSTPITLEHMDDFLQKLLS